MGLEQVPVDEAGRTTPFGLLRFAEEYRRAAEIVHADPKLITPAFQLIGQSFELALKAFLLFKGVSLKDLRSKALGHDLVALWKRADAEGIGLVYTHADLAAGVIDLLNPHYMAHEFRYIVTGTKTIPAWDFASNTAKYLTYSLHDDLLAHRIGEAAAKARIEKVGRF
ncbi:hypothetical protein D9T17_11145 [Lysobacter enzymogenes]|uniref:HEPN domain-containing protein n=2 Tax=Lysobacter enzymogenes TaxID=69 RepID=A0A3N2RHW8_LYSEN|nr:hypothetical protein D9T17_11145 [Lysobacter enzymogenes]